jgi:hypothetical protein
LAEQQLIRDGLARKLCTVGFFARNKEHARPGFATLDDEEVLADAHWEDLQKTRQYVLRNNSETLKLRNKMLE